MPDNTQFKVIGRAEKIDLPEQSLLEVPAKVDTGADVSALWASDISVTGEGLRFRLFGPGNTFYTGKYLIFPNGSYGTTRVSSSFGHRQLRYTIRVPIRLAGRRILATFTLTDRSNKTYPILLGRRLLHGKFVVDVTQGHPLRIVERIKKAKMKLELKRKQDVS